ncbi:hypothetical protein D3C84_916750 [compost metagenome]
MNKDALAWMDWPCMMKTVPGRDCRDGYGGSMDVVQVFRRKGKACLADRHKFGVSAQPSHRAHDSVAGTETRDAGADSLDNSRHFGAEYYW